jgi:hypothetical protein
VFSNRKLVAVAVAIAACVVWSAGAVFYPETLPWRVAVRWYENTIGKTEPACRGGKTRPVNPATLLQTLRARGFDVDLVANDAWCDGTPTVAENSGVYVIASRTHDHGLPLLECHLTINSPFAKGNANYAAQRFPDTPRGRVVVGGANVECFYGLRKYPGDGSEPQRIVAAIAEAMRRGENANSEPAR